MLYNMLEVPSTTILMAGMALIVLANPHLYEQNLVAISLLSGAWVLQETSSLAVVRSFLLAVLQGEAFHKICVNFELPSMNIVWITFFTLLQDNLPGIARLVCALALISYCFRAIWNRISFQAIHSRSQPDYWTVEEETTESSRQNRREIEDLEDEERSDWGTVFQLMMTKKGYDLLSRRVRESSELVRTRREFLESPERHTRDRFTMAVISALSKQGTVHVIRSAELSQVQRFAKNAATFVERKFTSSAFEKLDTLFEPLPFFDPSGLGVGGFTMLIAASLVAHKQLFRYVKIFVFGGKTGWLLFLLKHVSRLGISGYLSIRYLLGFLKTPKTADQSFSDSSRSLSLLVSPARQESPPGTSGQESVPSQIDSTPLLSTPNNSIIQQEDRASSPISMDGNQSEDDLRSSPSIGIDPVPIVL